MASDKVTGTALEQAARAVHEAFNGAGTWSKAASEQRSHARHSVRLMLAALAKNGLEVVEGSEAPKSDAPSAAPEPSEPPASAAPAPPASRLRPPPRRF